MKAGACVALTSEGVRCRLKATAGEFCHLHDPEARKARAVAKEADRRASLAHWEKGKHLRELVDLVEKIAERRGWRSSRDNYDTEDWQHATIVVRRRVPGQIIDVTGAIDISTGDTIRVSTLGTSAASYGIKELGEHIKEEVGKLPWLTKVPNEPVQDEPQAAVQPLPRAASRNVFIVHGHDVAAKEEVARFIGKIGLNPIILHEQANRGRTLIEKFEQHGDAAYAVALLTPDDVGAPAGQSDSLLTRARQNVVFELGYFLGRLGRAGACGLVKGDVELPSDYSGVVYIPLDSAGAWRLLLVRELKAAGLDVDANLAI